MSAPLLCVRGLRLGFAGHAEAVIDALDLQLHAGEILGLVGESGAGKSLLARSLLGLLPPGAQWRGGDIRYRDEDLQRAADFQRVRGRRIAYVFQDAASSLHPLQRVRQQLHECLRVHQPGLRAAQRQQQIDLALDDVGLGAEPRWQHAYPHQLSGGQRQRVMLALSLLPQPDLLIADEPTSALDPVLARRICDLLVAATKARKMALLLISHDRPRVAEYCARVIQLQQGRAHSVDRLALALPPRQASPNPSATVVRPALIEARALSLRYAAAWSWPWQRPPALALDLVDIRLGAGQRLALVGSSGSGKSTLARALLGLMPRCAGELQWFGRAFERIDRRQLRRWRARVQLVFQDPLRSLDPLQRVDHMLLEALSLAEDPAPAPDRMRLACAALRDVGLDESALGRYPQQFSGGQRQRLAIARALATQPQVLICDEATSALDHATQTQILQLLDRLARARGLALLFVSHDLDAVALLCDSMLVLDAGRVVESGEPQTLLQQPGSPALRALIAARPRAPLAEHVVTT